jgi:pyridinium-3,5-biscarboxylic acid mononucleotide synthase
VAVVDRLREILDAVARGETSPDAAAESLARGEVRYLGEFATLDLGRQKRKGMPEVVYAPGKTPEQVSGACRAMVENGLRAVVSGFTPAQRSAISEVLPGVAVREAGRALVVGPGEPSLTGGRLAILTAGTSDVPVAEEAGAVAREMGCAVETFYDVGVAGIHRLAVPLEAMESFDPDCLVVVAGMEGALPSVVAGLVAVPVVGLPTSTGYGLGGDGTAAILGMLQTCSPGLAVVNVDNGVGAGAMAGLIANRAARRVPERRSG